jgi:hypothetical protein
LGDENKGGSSSNMLHAGLFIPTVQALHQNQNALNKLDLQDLQTVT